MKNILVIQGGGRPNGNTSQLVASFVKGAEAAGHEVEVVSSRLKAFIERFYCLAQEDENPPLGRYEKYPEKDCALLMTAADDFFWTFEQAVSYYQFAVVNYIGFCDKGMLLAGGCGDTNGKPQIEKTNHLAEGYEFGKNIYK